MDTKPIAHLGLKDSAPLELALNSAKQAASPEEVKKAATQFEGLLLQQMISAMWETVPKSELTGSKEEGLYRDMLNQAMAQEIAENQSIGVANVIAKDINKIEAKLGKK